MNMDKLIEAVKWTYGFSTKEAKEYIKSASDTTLNEILCGYYQQTHLAFCED